jgi:hypothetical protein
MHFLQQTRKSKEQIKTARLLASIQGADRVRVFPRLR